MSIPPPAAVDDKCAGFWEGEYRSKGFRVSNESASLPPIFILRLALIGEEAGASIFFLTLILRRDMNHTMDTDTRHTLETDLRNWWWRSFNREVRPSALR